MFQLSSKATPPKFSNPNKFDSSSQFNPKLAGKLYQEIKQIEANIKKLGEQ